VTAVPCKVTTVILCFPEWAVGTNNEACLKNGVTILLRLSSLWSDVSWSSLFSSCWSKHHERNNVGNRLIGFFKLCSFVLHLVTCLLVKW